MATIANVFRSTLAILSLTVAICYDSDILQVDFYNRLVTSGEKVFGMWVQRPDAHFTINQMPAHYPNGGFTAALCKAECEKIGWCKAFMHRDKDCKLLRGTYIEQVHKDRELAGSVLTGAQAGGHNLYEKQFWRQIPNSAVKIPRRNDIRSTTTADKIGCFRECQKELECASFEFTASDGKCVLMRVLRQIDQNAVFQALRRMQGTDFFERVLFTKSIGKELRVDHPGESTYFTKKIKGDVGGRKCRMSCFNDNECIGYNQHLHLGKLQVENSVITRDDVEEEECVLVLDKPYHGPNKPVYREVENNEWIMYRRLDTSTPGIEWNDNDTRFFRIK